MSKLDVNQVLLVVLRGQVELLIDKILAESGVQPGSDGKRSPDGRPLYLYSFTTETFSTIQPTLKRSLEAFRDTRAGQYGFHCPSWLSSLFVLYGAHWFRRENIGGHETWKKLGVLPEGLKPSDRGRLVEQGLQAWGIEVVETDYGHREWLHTLALNGGIPARVLAKTDRTWVSGYFEAIVSDPRSAFATTLQDFRLIAESQAHLLNDAYRHPEITDQSARLLQTVTLWRRSRPGSLSQTLAPEWIEANFPDWRREIPLHVDASPELIKALLGRLLTLDSRLPDKRLGVSRQLNIIREGGRVISWTETARINSDGICAATDFGLNTYHKDWTFDLYASVEDFGQGLQTPKRIGRAHVDMPEHGDPDLHCRSLPRTAQLDLAPLLAAVFIEARQKGKPSHRATVHWRGATAQRASIFVFEAQGEPSVKGMLHTLIGTGSLTTRHDQVIILLPAKAMIETAETQDEGVDGASTPAIEHLGTQNGQSLWLVSGQILIRYGKDLHRIATGGNSDTDYDLDVRALYISDLSLEEPYRLLCRAPVYVEPYVNGSPAQQGDGSLTSSRGAGTSGRQTLTWRSPTGFIRAKIPVLALPETFTIKAQRYKVVPGTGDTELSWSGLPGWRLDIELPMLKIDGGEADVSSVKLAHNSNLDGNAGAVTLVTGDAGFIHLTLYDPHGRPTLARLLIRQDWPAVRRADGSVLDGPFEVDLPELTNLTLDLRRRQILQIELKAWPPVTVFHRLPPEAHKLDHFRNEIEALLAIADARGPIVELSLVGGERLGRVRRSSKALDILDRQILNRTGKVGQIVVRSLIAPKLEHAASVAGDEGFRVPNHLAGPCLTYLRAGDRVLTRPVVVMSDKTLLQAPTRVGNFALIEEAATRESRIVEFLNSVEEEETIKEVLSLRDVIAGLRGLSPRSIDVVRLLTESPVALCTLLLETPAPQRRAILDLENGLPFMWMSLPIHAWKRALNLKMVRDMAIWKKLPGELNAAEAAMNGILDLGREITVDAPWFAAFFTPGQCGEVLSEFSPMLGPFIDLWAELPRVPMLELFDGTDFVSKFAPLQRVNSEANPPVLVPLALAAQCHGRVEPSPAHIILMRSALLADPEFVQTGFVLAMHDNALWKETS